MRLNSNQPLQGTGIGAEVSQRRVSGSMGDASEAKKALKVKAGMVTRIAKELDAYEQEQAREEAKLQQMREEDSVDASDIKHQQSVTEESCMMMPDTRRRLQKALDDLQALVDEHSSDERVSDCEEMANAREVLNANLQATSSSE